MKLRIVFTIMISNNALNVKKNTIYNNILNNVVNTNSMVKDVYKNQIPVKKCSI